MSFVLQTGIPVSVGIALLSTALAAPPGPGDAAPAVNPFPRSVISQSIAEEWNFERSPEGWQSQRDATLLPATAPGQLTLKITGADPILESPPLEANQIPIAAIRMRSTAPGPGQIFWIGDESPRATEMFSTRFEIEADGEWHQYLVTGPEPMALSRIRFDPATGPGEATIDWIRVDALEEHPLEIESIAVRERGITAVIRNHGAVAREIRSGERSATVESGASVELSTVRVPGTSSVEPIAIEVHSHGLPRLRRTAIAINPYRTEQWLWLSNPQLAVLIAPDGSGAKIILDARTVAWLAPLALRDGKPVAFHRADDDSPDRIVFRGEDKERLTLSLKRNRLLFSYRGSAPIEGPVVRVIGGLEQGLLAGVEHLGKGEASSSTLDLRGPEHLRHTPPPRDLTMPLMACVTANATVAVHWKDPSLQPVFATPNFFDGTEDHRMALRGKKIEAEIQVTAGFENGGRLEDAILAGADRNRGLPPLPDPPRSHEEQLAFCLMSLNESVIRDRESGAWYHALVPGAKFSPEQPKFFADHLSTLFRLTGEVPEFAVLTPGGGHLRNDAIYFLSGRANDWLKRVRAEAEGLIQRQQPDGSFRYGGEFRDGHFEDTSSGQCAGPAARLLEIARLTGDGDALAAGLKTLDFMKRFRTPRGAQIWECPLHAPDLLAAAHLTRAYVTGFELTGRREYRELAVRWALSGVPFVYQWSDRPVMLYATIPTLCATNWQAPVWIGRPVQWCGLVYADALLDLAPHDSTLDWRHLAEGILISGEQQQYAEGPSQGLLADSITLENQQLHPYDINPTALVSLRMRLDGQTPSLFYADDGSHRVVAPFPVAVEEGSAHISARKGLSYQIIIDGARVIDVQSQGSDLVPLNDPVPVVVKKAAAGES